MVHIWFERPHLPSPCTVGHTSDDSCFHKKNTKAGVMTFVAHCTSFVVKPNGARHEVSDLIFRRKALCHLTKPHSIPRERLDKDLASMPLTSLYSRSTRFRNAIETLQGVNFIFQIYSEEEEAYQIFLIINWKETREKKLGSLESNWVGANRKAVNFPCCTWLEETVFQTCKKGEKKCGRGSSFDLYWSWYRPRKSVGVKRTLYKLTYQSPNRFFGILLRLSTTWIERDIAHDRHTCMQSIAHFLSDVFSSIYQNVKLLDLWLSQKVPWWSYRYLLGTLCWWSVIDEQSGVFKILILFCLYHGKWDF